MKTRCLAFLLLFTCVLHASADDVTLKMKRDNVQNKQEVSQDDTSIGRGGRGGRGGTTTGGMEEIKADRTELYSQVIKRYGRWEGYGKPITKEYASHLPCYFMLTFTGSSKYPIRMQAYNGYHKLTTDHGLGTYLVDKNGETDTDADSTWIEKLKTITQWDFVYNEKNEISIERAYDTNGKLIFAYYPVKLGNRVAGTFTDAWGMPAKLRKNGGAQVVYVSYDENGFECLHEFYDEQGYRQKNKDGSYMSRMTNRSDGLTLTKASCNITGQRMIDSFGNCGMQAEYDKFGNLIYDINMDENWNPARVEHGVDPFYYNMIKRKYEYDLYNRLVKVSFIDLENKPDTNSVGIHSFVRTFNSRGNVTSLSFYDLKGNLCVNPYTGMSRWENEYDENGNVICLRNYGNSDVLSKNNYKEMYWTYDRDGNEISHLYIDFDGDSIWGNSYIKTSGVLRKLTKDDKRPNDYVEIRQFKNAGQVVKIEYDTKGRQTLWEYSDFEGNAIAPYGYWKNITTYENYGDSLEIMTDYYVDSLNAVVKLENNNWGIKKEISCYKDERLQTTDIYQYNADSTFYNAWRNTYDSEGHKICEASLNKYGKISRRGSTLYHHVGIEYNIKGNGASSYVGYDEFEDPAYIEDTDGVSHFWNFINGDLVTYYDEHGTPITDMDSFRDSLPAVMSISVVDSIAYSYGLCDGDIILKYGDWYSGLNLQKQDSNNWFYFKLIEYADREKEILVLRHIPRENRSVVLTRTLPVGTIQELGIFPQLIYYTTKEKKRHEDALKKYVDDTKMVIYDNTMQSNGTHKVFMRKPNRIKGYIPTNDAAAHHYNPAIVLSMAKYVIRDSNVIADKYWNLGMGEDTLYNILRAKDMSDYYISVSTDLKDFYDGVPYYSSAQEWGFVYINDEQYARVKEINDDFIKRMGTTFNSLYREKTDINVSKKTLRKILPHVFFNETKKMPEVVYTPHALTFINSDSLRLPDCFNGLEMIYIGKAQCPDVYNNIREKMSAIDTTGYIRLPNFYSEDLALVKPMGHNLYSEIFLIYFNKNNVRVLSQKGIFSSDELMAVQKTYGKQKAFSLNDEIDNQSQIPLILARTEQDGLARQADVEGTFVILEYNKWNMLSGLENIAETIENGKEEKKRLLLMRIHWKDDNSFDYFDSPQVYYFNSGTLGMRIMDWDIRQSLYDRVASAYEKYKRTHNKEYK